MKFSRLALMGIVFVAGIVIGIGGSVIVSLEGSKKTTRATDFSYRFLGSVVDGTEFHKEYCPQHILDYIREHATEFGYEFTVFHYDYTFGIYEFVVIFDNGNIFFFDVTRWDDKFRVVRLEAGELHGAKNPD